MPADGLESVLNLQDDCKERKMWKVGDVEPVRVWALRAIPTGSMSPPMTESRLSLLRMRLEPLPGCGDPPRIGC